MLLRSISLVLVLLVVAEPAQAQCPGCPSRSGCPEMPVEEEEHCHWLEVTGLMPGGVAEQAGVRPGDVLFSYGGRTVGCMGDFARAREGVKGESADVVFRRGRAEVKLRVARREPLGAYLKEWQKDIAPDRDAKVIRGVGELTWASGKANTFMAALEAVLRQQGAQIDYEFLSGVSGAAFRLHFFDTWCPSSTDPGCGYDATKPALAACGYDASWLRLSSDGKNRPQLLAGIRKSINAGMPVLAIELIAAPEWGVITGYQKSGAELFVRTFFDQRKNYELAQKFPWLVVVPRKTGRAPARAVSMRRGFSIVAENLSTEKYGEYYSGLAAFDKWQTRLLKDDFTALDSAQFDNALRANYWIFSRLVSDRQTGLAYLARAKKELPKHGATLDQLTALYDAEVRLLAPFEEKLPRPGAATRPEDWTREMRVEQADLLAQAQELEVRALPLWQALAGVR